MWHAGKCDLLAYGNEQLQKVVHKYAILMHEVTQTDGRDSLRILPQRFRNQKLLHGKNIKYSQFDTDISNVTDRTVKVYGTYSYSYIKIRLLSKMKRERGNSCLSRPQMYARAVPAYACSRPYITQKLHQRHCELQVDWNGPRASEGHFYTSRQPNGAGRCLQQGQCWRR